MGKYFGTDGFRGYVNKNLTILHALKIGEFIGYYYKSLGNNKFIIGKDTRLSGDMLEDAITAGILSTGGIVYKLGVTTTPSVAYLAKVDGFACGIMISASHNPYHDNGIKLFNSLGEKMTEDVILKIEDYIDGKSNIEYAKSNEVGIVIDYKAGLEAYISHLIQCGPNLNGMTIGLDLANGSATSCAKYVFEALGAEVISINDSPDGLNINQNAGSTHIEAAQKLSKEKGIMTFSFDGDADRCLATDELGNVITGDHILYLYANYLKKNNELKNNTVVTTVMSNYGLYKALDKLNISYAKTKVGDKYVYEYMKEFDCMIGGEQSGHIIFIKDSPTGDGILTALKVLNVIVNENKTLSELTKNLIIYPQVLINVKVKDKKLAQEDIDVKNIIKDIEEKLGNTGRILVRESGTEPLVRVMVEAESEEQCRILAQSVVDKIIEKGYQL